MVESVDNMNISHSIFSCVEIQKHLLENYDGQAFNVIQVLRITCSPSLNKMFQRTYV